jgi:thioredoxin-like negative regulator of GroEL
MKPVVNRLSEEYQGQVDFLAVDVTLQDSRELMNKYRFVGRPQFVVVARDGSIVASRNGIQSYERLKADIEAALAKP